MTLANSAIHYDSATFRGRVRAALVAKAVAVIQSTPRSDQAAGVEAAATNASRRLADAVVRNPNAALDTFVAVVANVKAFADVADHTAVLDGVITNTVEAAWAQVADSGG